MPTTEPITNTARLAELVLTTGVHHMTSRLLSIRFIEMGYNDGIDCSYDFCNSDGDTVFRVSFSSDLGRMLRPTNPVGTLTVSSPVDPDENEWEIIESTDVKMVDPNPWEVWPVVGDSIIANSGSQRAGKVVDFLQFGDEVPTLSISYFDDPASIYEVPANMVRLLPVL